MPYDAQVSELARCAVRHHGELREVFFRDGNKDYDLIFADGTVLRPYLDASLQHEYQTYDGYGEIARQLGGTHPYSLLAFGYQGTGPGCFTTFLNAAGFDVKTSDIVEVSPPARLRRDGFVGEGDAGEQPGAVEAAEPEPAATEEPEAVAAPEPEPAPEQEAAPELEPAPEPEAAPEPEPAPAAPAAAPADWYADPAGRHQYRYWDGASWTDHVADNGTAALDPLAPAQARPAKHSGPVEFDEKDRVVKVAFPMNPVWPRYTEGNCNYMVRTVDTLLEATEVLRKLHDIPGMHYYICETRDGKLCRDMNGYYTEAPLETRDLHLATQGYAAPAPVECESLTMFGDPFANQATVAALKKNGKYAKLVLLMECGHCGYKSPVETEAGERERQCYCCGTMNIVQRGAIDVFGDGGMVQI